MYVSDEPKQVNKKEEVIGKIKSIHFRKDDFLIGTIRSDENEDVKVVGSMYGLQKGDSVVVRGSWGIHPKFGKQFSVESWERPMPKTKEQIIAFLSSTLIKGCGPKQSVAIVEKLGMDTIGIISREGVSSLDGVKGIGKKRSISIVESIRATFEIQEIISKLLVYGITTNMAMKAYLKFKSNTLAILEENPYRLVELNLVGFLTADEIAKKMGIFPTSNFRIDACVEFLLRKLCFDSGHSYVNETLLFKEVERALNHNSTGDDIVTMDEVVQGVFRLEEYKIEIEKDMVYPKLLFKSEDKLARKLSIMRGSRDGGALSILDNKITMYQKKNGIILAEKQREAVSRLINEQLLVLTGGPGTGKTTVIKTMLDVFKSIYPKAEIALVAPTGRASRKLSEVTKMEAKTIHRLIGYRQGELPLFNDRNTLTSDLLIVDEMSMVDTQLANLLIQAVDNNTKILFVGDVDQLPSVNPGNVLGDLIASGIPTVTLTEVFRQAQESQIITNAHRINKGKSLLIDKYKNDLFFIENEVNKDVADLITLSVVRFLKLGYSISDILVLSPMRKGPVGTLALNEAIREHVNPPASNKKEWESGNKLFREGDKIIQLKNIIEKDVYNGDVGVVKEICRELHQDNEMIEVMKCEYPNGMVTYLKGELSQIDLAYAITIHKSQGGESPVVIIPATTSHHIMLARNLMYTGLTRAKEKMVFVGTFKAMNIAIANDSITKRNSRLAHRIIEYRNAIDSQKVFEKGG